jgi:hypothetical protein
VFNHYVSRIINFSDSVIFDESCVLPVESHSRRTARPGKSIMPGWWLNMLCFDGCSTTPSVWFHSTSTRRVMRDRGITITIHCQHRRLRAVGRGARRIYMWLDTHTYVCMPSEMRLSEESTSATNYCSWDACLLARLHHLLARFPRRHTQV